MIFQVPEAMGGIPVACRAGVGGPKMLRPDDLEGSNGASRIFTIAGGSMSSPRLPCEQLRSIAVVLAVVLAVVPVDRPHLARVGGPLAVTGLGDEAAGPGTPPADFHHDERAGLLPRKRYNYRTPKELFI